jgi:hypothetical protein
MFSKRQPFPDGSPNVVAARLRALPQPAVPADLEARLLAAIPAAPLLQRRRRRRRLWAGAAGTLAAACLLACLTWPRSDDQRGIRPGIDASTSTVPTPPHVVPRPRDDSGGVPAWLEARRVLDGAEQARFAWPLEETMPISVRSIPADLLE